MNRALLLSVVILHSIVSVASAQENQAACRPSLYGAVKAGYQVSLYDGQSRFVVNNVRVGLRGALAEKICYNIQTDIGSGRDFTLLDAAVMFRTGSFEVEIGQQTYRFSRDVGSGGPSTLLFNGASLLANYLTDYYGNDAGGYSISSLGSKDIGLRLAYTIRWRVPFTFTAGVFNGAGGANPVWDRSVNIVGRIDIGAKKGFGGAISHYNGEAPEVSRADAAGYTAYRPSLVMWGAEVRYNGDRYIVEVEAGQRRLGVESIAGREVRKLVAARVQGYYAFPLRQGAVKRIMPTLRWDMVDNAEYAVSNSIATFSAHRVTAGVIFGFVEEILGADLRINAEKFFFKDKPATMASTVDFQDKVTLDLVVSF